MISASPDGASKVPQGFPTLGIEWPDSPQPGVALADVDMADRLVKHLQLLLQVDPLPSVEAMRSSLEGHTKGYHALSLPKEAWMAKLTALWDEFADLHTSQEQRRRTRAMIQQEEKRLSRLCMTQAEVCAQAEAARKRSQMTSLRVQELQRELQEAEEAHSQAQADADTIQSRLDRLQEEVFLSEIRVADLKRSKSRPSIGLDHLWCIGFL